MNSSDLERLLALARERGLLLVSAHAVWEFECYGSDGRLKWKESFSNLVVTEGLNTLLTRTFKTIPADVNWYVGLKATGTVVAGDIMSSHAGWTEIYSEYSQANRPAFTPGTVSGGSVDNSGAKAVFSITGPVTVYGAFLTSNNTKNGTTGLLHGGGDFSSPRAVISGDTVNVQVTLTVTAA